MFRRLVAVLALLLVAGASASQRYVVNAGGVAALVDAGGAELLPAGRFDSIFEVRAGALYAAGSAGEYDLYDSGGRLMAGPFEMIADMNGALIFRRGGLYGALDGAGAVQISLQWTQLTTDGSGSFLSLDADPLDEQPDEVLNPAPTGVMIDGPLSPFRDGRMPFRAPDGRFGCLDARGNAVIPAEWGCIGEFRDGAAIVSDGAMYGLIGPDGALVLPTSYTWLERGDGLLAGLREDATLELRSADGRTLLCEIPAPGPVQLAGSRAAVATPDAAVLYEPTGKEVYTAAPDALFFPGTGGQTIVAEGDTQTLLDPDGAPVGPPRQRILPLTPGRYAFQTFDADFQNVACGLMASDGRDILPANYREILPAAPDKLILVTETNVTFADTDGHPIKTWPRPQS